MPVARTLSPIQRWLREHSFVQTAERRPAKRCVQALQGCPERSRTKLLVLVLWSVSGNRTQHGMNGHMAQRTFGADFDIEVVSSQSLARMRFRRQNLGGRQKLVDVTPGVTMSQEIAALAGLAPRGNRPSLSDDCHLFASEPQLLVPDVVSSSLPAD